MDDLGIVEIKKKGVEYKAYKKFKFQHRKEKIAKLYDISMENLYLWNFFCLNSLATKFLNN